MCGDTEPDIERTAVTHGRFPIGDIDFYLMVIEEAAIQRKNRFVNGFLGYKEQAATVWITINPCSLARRCDEVQQIGGQRFSGLDVDANARQVIARANCGNSNPGIVRERSQNTLRPDRRACWRFGQGRAFMTQRTKESAGNDTGGAAGPLYLDRAAAKCSGLLGEQRVLVPGRDQPMVDHNARRREGTQGLPKLSVASHDQYT